MIDINPAFKRHTNAFWDQNDGALIVSVRLEALVQALSGEPLVGPGPQGLLRLLDGLPPGQVRESGSDAYQPPPANPEFKILGFTVAPGSVYRARLEVGRRLGRALAGGQQVWPLIAGDLEQAPSGYGYVMMTARRLDLLHVGPLSLSTTLSSRP